MDSLIIALLLFVAGICIILFNVFALVFTNPLIALLVLLIVLVFLQIWKQ